MQSRSDQVRAVVARRRRASTIPLFATALLLASAGCGGSEEPAGSGGAASRTAAPTQEASPSKPGAGAREAAIEIFQTRCYTCHGMQGKGDGPGSTALDPKPRNFQDQEWQASVSDEHIATIIQYGGAAVGRSPTMPGNPDLTSRPEVVAALVQYVRQLGKGGSAG